MKMRVFSVYALVPDHHTDEGSMLFFAAYFCRLNFPLCYNFLNLLTTADTSNSPATATTFVRVIGKIDLVPLLGNEFNLYFPLVIVVICTVVFFNLHGRLMRMCGGFGELFFDDDEPTEDIVMEGRQLIEQARAMEERRLGRVNGGQGGSGRNGDGVGGRREGGYGGVVASDRRRGVTDSEVRSLDETGRRSNHYTTESSMSSTVASFSSRLVRPFFGKTANEPPLPSSRATPPPRPASSNANRASALAHQSLRTSRQSGDSDVADSERRELLGSVRSESRNSQGPSTSPGGLGIGQIFGGRSRGSGGEPGGVSGNGRASDFAGVGYSTRPSEEVESPGGFSDAVKGFLGKWNSNPVKSAGYTSLTGSGSVPPESSSAGLSGGRNFTPTPRKTTPTFARAGGTSKKGPPLGLFDGV
ncbi:hypothetical protein HDU93_005861 [Gonapodya sp. JEL0774]|nr:hypothetical protein HDU93_005861 [Gonapodya sp. JEL0774]